MPVTAAHFSNDIVVRTESYQKLFHQISFPDKVQKIAVTSSTREDAGRSSYRTSFNFYNIPRNAYSSVKTILLNLHCMGVRKAGFMIDSVNSTQLSSQCSTSRISFVQTV